MTELVNYCAEPSNDMNHRQARVFKSYIIASLLGIDYNTEVRFFKEEVCYRVAMFQ